MENKNYAYLGITLNNKDYNIGSVYYGAELLVKGAVNPLTAQPYTEEELKNITDNVEFGSGKYIEAKENAVLGFSLYDSEELVWFDKENAAKILKHPDPLFLKDNKAYTKDNELVAVSLD